MVANAVLYYDGSRPVNLFSALIVLVGSQVATLVLLCIFLLGGFKRIIRTLSMFNPASLWINLLNRLNSQRPSSFSDIFALLERGGSYSRQYLLIYLAQHFTVALNLGIVAAILYLVTVSDMAFGWNTTLNIENLTMYQWFHGLSLPWNQFVPAAVPTEELVDSSRFYRLQSQLHKTDWNPDQLGTWWLYILMAVIVYGLLPRLIALICSGVRYDQAIANAINLSPGINQVLARMNSPLVTTFKDEQTDGEASSANPLATQRRQFSQGLLCLMIEWSMESQSTPIANPTRLTTLGVIPEKYFVAGGNQSLADDRDILHYVAEHRPAGVAILVKAWEPPMLDLVDFIEDLRGQLQSKCPIIILLKGLPKSSVSSDQLDSWEYSLNRLNDSALYVEVL